MCAHRQGTRCQVPAIGDVAPERVEEERSTQSRALRVDFRWSARLVKGAARVLVRLRCGAAVAGSARRQMARGRAGALPASGWRACTCSRGARAASLALGTLAPGGGWLGSAVAVSARRQTARGGAGSLPASGWRCVPWLPRRARCCAGSRDDCAWRGRAGRGWRGARCALGRLCRLMVHKFRCHPWPLNCPSLTRALRIGSWWSARLVKGAARTCVCLRLCLAGCHTNGHMPPTCTFTAPSPPVRAGGTRVYSHPAWSSHYATQSGP